MPCEWIEETKYATRFHHRDRLADIPGILVDLRRWREVGTLVEDRGDGKPRSAFC